MNSDTHRSRHDPTWPDDEQLSALVRATADDWRLPPQRLDQPSWRERVGGRSARRRRGLLARLARPAMTAIVGTVIAAFVAVWLTAPRTAIVGKPPPASGAFPSATASRPNASTLPALFRDGALPDPAQLLVRSGGAYQIVDLAKGTLGAVVISPHTGPTTVLPRPGGGWLCICGDWTGSSAGRPTGIDVSLEWVSADGSPGPGAVLRTIRGEADPALPDASQPELVDVRASASADGRTAFVGWSARKGAASWTAGIDVIDIATATVVSSTPLAMAEPAGARGAPTTRIAPVVASGPSGDAILVSDAWYVEEPSPTPPSGTDHWTASFDGRTIGSLTAAAARPGESCAEFERGVVDATTYYVLCWTSDGRLLAERNRVDGTPVGQSALPRLDARLDGGSLVLRQGDLLFLWDPVTARLTRFDLRSGAVASAYATAAVPSTSPLDALAALGRQVGRWIAPTTLAKAFLSPALAISADGTRIYALGIDSAGGDGSGGSRGVYVFDVSSLQPVGHWAPTADLVSLAISPDGRFVYAAGQAGVDMAGNKSADRASITVYDTADGSVRLIAGRLSSGEISFPEQTVR